MGNELSFRILQDIARDLSGEIVSFPTFLDITVQVHAALNKPDVTIEQLGRLISAEPMLSTKVIHVANSVAMNPSGRKIVDVNSAITQIGMNAVRSVSFAVAMEQLLNTGRIAPFATLSQRLWEHTIQVAALARVVARRLTRVSPDEAMFAGLVHDLGVFYLLSRAVNFPELMADPVELHQLLVQWHDHIGHALLAAMGMPEELLLVVQEHELERTMSTPKTLADVLFIANKVANLEHGWRDSALCEALDAGSLAQLFDAEALNAVISECAEDVASLKSALSA